MGVGMELIESIRESGGWLNRYRHDSSACACPMTFSVYLPPAAEAGPVPAVYWLSGLTCTDDNARTKAGAQRYAAELGIALVFPDTSPRGADVPDVPERYDLGQGAGFYVNATQPPWAGHYRMYDYVVEELPALIERELPLMTDRQSVALPLRVGLRADRTSGGQPLAGRSPPAGRRRGRHRPARCW